MSITLEQAREALKAVVEEQGPDFRYVIDRTKYGGASCYYVPMPEAMAVAYGDPQKGITGCLIGRVLDRLGETRQRVNNAGGVHTPEVGLGHQGAVGNLATYYPDMFAKDGAGPYLTLAQLAQDKGMTWGEAYAYAERYAADPSSYHALIQEVTDRVPDTEKSA